MIDRMKSMKLDFENLRDVVWVTSPALSADGKHVSYVQGISDYDTGEIITSVREVNLDTKEVWMLDGSGLRQKEPVYAPNGAYLAFLASDGRPWQVWVKNCLTGEVRQMTHCRYGADNVQWSSDSTKLVFEVKYYPMQSWEDEEASAETLYKYETKEEILNREFSMEEYQEFLYEQKDQPMVFENLIYKLDSEYGMRDGSRTALAVCDINTGISRLITKLDQPYKVPSFVQNDTKVACYGYPYTHCKELNSEIYLIDIETLECSMIEKSVPSYYSFPVQEDIKGNLLYCGVQVLGDSVLPAVYSVDAAGGESRLLFETWPVCHGLDPLYTGDAHLEGKDCPFYRDAEGNIFFVSYAMGRSNVYCWDGENVYAVTAEDCVLRFYASGNGSMLVLKSDWNRPAYLSVQKLQKNEDGMFAAKEVSRLAEENTWLDSYELTEPQPLSAVSKDGKTTIYGWIFVPEGKNIPAVMDVHGGPEACYVRGFFYEAQMLAAKGMAVLICDPRGSAGYGPEFMSGTYAYGQEAVDDYQAFLDEALKQYPQIDPKRVGITGGSYGGFMTNKMISVTDRFAAAVTQRTWVNPSTSYGTGDMGFYSAGPQNESFVEYMKNRVRRSIMKYIRNVHIPVLILHGEQDYRCALEQGEQVYHALRSLNPSLPVKIVIFPEENHGVTREGKMHNQIRHMKELVEWFEKYLGGVSE